MSRFHWAQPQFPGLKAAAVLPADLRTPLPMMKSKCHDNRDRNLDQEHYAEPYHAPLPRTA